MVLKFLILNEKFIINSMLLLTDEQTDNYNDKALS